MIASAGGCGQVIPCCTMDQVIDELTHDVKYQTTVDTLLRQLTEAKQRQDIMEYKQLYRQLLNTEVDIYTVPYSSQVLFPLDRNRDHDAEFWFQ